MLKFHAELAEETVLIGVKEEYTTASMEKVDLRDDIKYMLDNTNTHSSANVSDTYFVNSTILKTHLNNVRLTNATTNEAIDYWNREEEREVIALNFASAKNPGGGFLKGMCAQEEALARSSMLYRSLIHNDMYYRSNRANLNGGLYNNICIYSTRVPLIRDMSKNNEPLVLPTNVDIITCPAVNMRATVRQRISTDVVRNTMYGRIKFIMDVTLKSIKEYGYKNPVLVLGAFGCGVFKNNPHDVANIFKTILQEMKDKIDECNLEIDFAIPGGINYDTFERVLGPHIN